MQKIRKKYLPKDDKKSLAHTLKSSKPLSKLSEKEKPLSMDRVSTPKGKSKLQIKDRPLSHKNDLLNKTAKHTEKKQIKFVKGNKQEKDKKEKEEKLKKEREEISDSNTLVQNNIIETEELNETIKEKN